MDREVSDDLATWFHGEILAAEIDKMGPRGGTGQSESHRLDLQVGNLGPAPKHTAGFLDDDVGPRAGQFPAQGVKSSWSASVEVEHKHIVRVLEDAAKPLDLRGRPVREDVKGERH